MAEATVGYVLKKFPRVSETFVLDEILALESLGVDVSIVSLKLADDGRFDPSVGRLRARAECLPRFGADSTLEALHAVADLNLAGPALDRALYFVDRLAPIKPHELLVQALLLARRVVEGRLGHLHAHFMASAAHTAYLAHVVTGVPFSITAHAKDVFPQTVDPSVFREIASAATAVVTVCDYNRRYIREKLLGESDRVIRVYNGIFPDEVRPAPETARAPRLILGVGRLVEKKGFDTLLEACALLAERKVKFSCTIVGEGEAERRLREVRTRLGLEQCVQLPGALRRDAVIDLMRQARVLAAPCRRAADGDQDALPTVLLESLALALPIVSTWVGGIPEIVDDGVEGLLLDEDDPAALSAALELLLTDDAFWRSCSSACRAKALARFDRRRTITPLVELFTRGVQEPAHGPASARPAVSSLLAITEPTGE